ncbi:MULTISPECIES: Dabb family protein [unclassified Serratia (in: enterobacteria)]|uniref:Dabb family protein n=1 Tax=unclassified Serratia (in: enterobacteria) TaxID=2647522 RepID=UPI003B437B83
MITFAVDASPEAIDPVRETHIPEHIEGVQAVEWGINDSLEAKNAAYTHCVLMTFQDEQAR